MYGLSASGKTATLYLRVMAGPWSSFYCVFGRCHLRGVWDLDAIHLT